MATDEEYYKQHQIIQFDTMIRTAVRVTMEGRGSS